MGADVVTGSQTTGALVVMGALVVAGALVVMGAHVVIGSHTGAQVVLAPRPRKQWNNPRLGEQVVAGAHVVAGAQVVLGAHVVGGAQVVAARTAPASPLVAVACWPLQSNETRPNMATMALNTISRFIVNSTS